MQAQFQLAGARFRPLEAQQKVVSLKIGTVCELVPEPTNPYDPDAIKVMLDGIHLGYVPRKQTGWYSEGFTATVVAVHGLFPVFAFTAQNED